MQNRSLAMRFRKRSREYKACYKKGSGYAGAFLRIIRDTGL